MRAGARPAVRRRHRDSIAQRDAGAAAGIRRPGAVLSATRQRAAAIAALGTPHRSCCTAACRVRRRYSRSRSPACSSGPAFVLVVGDLRALLPSMPYRGIKRGLWRAYTEFEECNVQWMADRALDVRQRRGAGGETLARRPDRASRPRPRRSATAISRIASDTCTGRAVRAADREPDRSAEGSARAPCAWCVCCVDAGIDADARHRRASGRRRRARTSGRRSSTTRGAHGVGDRSLAVAAPLPLDRLLPTVSRVRRVRAADAAGRRHSARAARGDEPPACRSSRRGSRASRGLITHEAQRAAGRPADRRRGGRRRWRGSSATRRCGGV